MFFSSFLFLFRECVRLQVREPQDAYSETLVMPNARGSAVVFSSCINHRVTPVVRGERRSLVQWVRSSEPRPRSAAEVWDAFRTSQQGMKVSL